MHLRHLNSTPKSFYFAITLHDVTALDALLAPPASTELPQPPFRPLDPFHLTISSRSKRNQTRIAVLQHDSITFDEQITFNSTLFQRALDKPSRAGRAGQQRFDKKQFTFSLVNLRLQNDKAKRFTVHSASIDLAQFASLDEGRESSQSFSLRAEKGVDGVSGPELRLTVHCKCQGDGAPSEASLLSVMGRTSRSQSTSHIRSVDDSKVQKWRERRDEKQEEDEVDMRRREREEEGRSGGDSLTSPRLTIIADDDAEDREDTKRGRRKRREEAERVEEESREAEEERQKEEEAMEREQEMQRRREKRRTLDAERIFHPTPAATVPFVSTSSASRAKTAAAIDPDEPPTPPPSVSMADILPTLRSASNPVFDRAAPASTASSSSSLFDLSSPSHLANLQRGATSATQRVAASRSRLANNADARDLNEVKRPSQPPTATVTTISPVVSVAPLAVQRPHVPAIRINVHAPPHLSRAERDEHERRYRQRMEPRLTFVLSTLFPSSLFSSAAYVTSVSSLSTLPSSPCIFFSSFTTLCQQRDFELELREKAEESRARALEQWQYGQMSDKQKAQWKKGRDAQSQSELGRMQTLSASRQQRRQREEADSQQRSAEQASVGEELRRIGEEWYRHGYSVSGVGLWRLISLCEMCCVEEVEVEGKRREDSQSDSSKKRKGKSKHKEHNATVVRVAHRAWMLESILRLLRRRVEESRDHYGELLWHINALLILQRSLRRRRDKSEAAADDDQYATLLIQVKDHGTALSVNGKTMSQPASGAATPAEVSSGSSSFLPYYPFIASASSFPFASLDYNRSAISSSLTPLGFLLHHITSYLRSLFSLLFHHLSFALSYRLPLSSILSPSSFSLETLLDFLTDMQSFLVLSQLQPHLRLCIVRWLLEAVGTRVVNAVMYEVMRVDGGGMGEQEQDAYELPLAPPIIQRMTSQPLPAISPAAATPSAAASAAFSASHPHLPAMESAQLLADPSSFLSLGMRLMMIYTALRDWMQREQYATDERDELCDALLPLHSLAMFCLVEKDGAREWRRECGGLSDAQVKALCRVYERVGGDNVGDGWRRKQGKGKERVTGREGDVWVEWPAVVGVQLDWSVVPFAAQSVSLPPALRDAPPSSVVDGLLDADALIIT